MLVINIDFGLSSKLEKATFEDFINNPEIDRQFYENIIRHYRNEDNYPYQPTNAEMKINFEFIDEHENMIIKMIPEYDTHYRFDKSQFLAYII